MASAIFYGVLERRITLDYRIQQYSNVDMKKIAPVVLEILRMGVYQIIYLEKIPKSAAVNESVRLAKENKAVKASGFINAVLRTLIRNIDHLNMPNPEKEPTLYLSVRYSCPPWLIRLWQEAYGEECAIKLLESAFNKPPIFARVNNIVISEEKLIERLNVEGVKANSITWLENAVELQNTGAIGQSDSYKEGLFHIQDLSSQICCAVLSPSAGQRVIDVCSAPGGKAFTLAEIMGNQGELLAFDKYKGKVGLIQQGAKRLNLSIVKASVRNAVSASPLDLADRVLCDAPCSGLGIIRRKPEIRYKLQSAIDSLPDLQYLILCKSSQLVKSGGILVYSTCTLNPKENNQVATKFLNHNHEFEPYAIKLPETLTRAVEEPDYQLTLMPHVHGTDGFFVAAFRKK